MPPTKPTRRNGGASMGATSTSPCPCGLAVACYQAQPRAAPGRAATSPYGYAPLRIRRLYTHTYRLPYAKVPLPVRAGCCRPAWRVARWPLPGKGYGHKGTGQPAIERSEQYEWEASTCTTASP